MAAITGWRAYFHDGAIRTSKTFTSWSDLPTDGMIGLVVYFDDGTKRRSTGGDYFYLDTLIGKYGMDKGGQVGLAVKYPATFLVRGMWTDDENMKKMEARMKSDFAP